MHNWEEKDEEFLWHNFKEILPVRGYIVIEDHEGNHVPGVWCGKDGFHNSYGIPIGFFIKWKKIDFEDHRKIFYESVIHIEENDMNDVF